MGSEGHRLHDGGGVVPLGAPFNLGRLHLLRVLRLLPAHSPARQCVSFGGGGVWSSGLGCGVRGLVFGVLGFGFEVWGLGFGVWGWVFRAWVWGSGFGVWGLVRART